MRYNLDLSALPVMEYKQMLKRQHLLPGRRLLLENIDRNFDILCGQGITTAAQLKKQLSTAKKTVSLATATGICQAYLVLLRREIGSLEQKPVPLASFPATDEKRISQLRAQGIRNSKEYYESGLCNADELFCLCDLVRINGVGAVAAKAFYEAGYRGVDDVAGAHAADMLEAVSKINAEKQYYAAKLGAKDMQFCIDFALLLSMHNRK